MRTKKHPGFLWLFEDLLDEGARSTLEEAAKQAGLQYAFPGTGMAGDLPVPDPVHPDLAFVRVTNDEQLQAYADINSRAYGFPLEEGRDGLVRSVLWKNDVHAYLAMRGNVPVACAGTIAVEGRLFVVLVATEPEWQRRGYGEAVTRKALYEGFQATGLTRATLMRRLPEHLSTCVSASNRFPRFDSSVWEADLVNYASRAWRIPQGHDPFPFRAQRCARRGGRRLARR